MFWTWLLHCLLVQNPLILIVRVTWLIRVCVTYSLISATCIVYTSDKTYSLPACDEFHYLELPVWHDAFICTTWRIHMYYITHSYVWPESFICVTRLIHMCDMTCSYVWHDSSPRVTGLIHMYDMTYRCFEFGACHRVFIYVWHDSFVLDTTNAQCDMTHPCVTWLTGASSLEHGMAFSYMCHGAFIGVIWLIHMCYRCFEFGAWDGVFASNCRWYVCVRDCACVCVCV